jgi:phosphohistidine swiveling domain-containing protein
MELQQGFTSIINWLAKTKEHDDVIADAIAYDNKKAERLTFLNKTIGLPINKTHVLPLSSFDINSKDLSSVIEDRGGENIQHAFRVAPMEGFANIFDIQKHYGLTFNEFSDKLKTLEIPLDKAEVRITNFRGSPLGFSAVILITKDGIIGEVVDDDLYVLTYMDSVKEGKSAVSFFKEPNSPVVVLSKNEVMVAKVNEILNKLSTNGKDAELNEAGYETSDGYVIGYYEYVEGKNGDSAFTDMNTKRISNNISVKDAILQFKRKVEGGDEVGVDVGGSTTGRDQSRIQGLVVYKKDLKVEGRVCLFRDDLVELPENVIFVSPMTTVDHLPFMKKALAVVTDFGGLMSHPAIISRELQIPTVVGTRNASKVLKEGDMIVIDMESGVIEIL